MRAVAQRVTRASVTVSGEVTGSIGLGLAVLVGVSGQDTIADVAAMSRKLVGLRIFSDDQGAMNRSVQDVGGSVLVVSQFTLYADARRGRRPSFVGAAAPDVAEPMVEELVAAIAKMGVPVECGRFRAAMEVELVNDGPVTISLETRGGRFV